MSYPFYVEAAAAAMIIRPPKPGDEAKAAIGIHTGISNCVRGGPDGSWGGQHHCASADPVLSPETSHCCRNCARLLGCDQIRGTSALSQAEASGLPDLGDALPGRRSGCLSRR